MDKRFFLLLKQNMQSQEEIVKFINNSSAPQKGQLNFFMNLSLILDWETGVWNLNQINTTEFMLDTAHQKEDLIHRLSSLSFVKNRDVTVVSAMCI